MSRVKLNFLADSGGDASLFQLSNLVFDIQAWVNGFQFEHPGFKVSGF